jgi:very-short-patch-repair endonuclease
MTWRTRGITNRRSQKSLRKLLRNSATSAETIVWKNLQGKKLLGKKFRRQVGIGRYIVDFYCPECRLGVELDGQKHFEPNVEEYQTERTRYLAGLGIELIRFENRAVHDDIELVLAAIEEALKARISPN